MRPQSSPTQRRVAQGSIPPAYLVLMAVLAGGVIITTFGGGGNVGSAPTPSRPPPLLTPIPAGAADVVNTGASALTPTNSTRSRHYVLPTAGRVEGPFIKQVVRRRNLRSKFKRICGQCVVAPHALPDGAPSTWQPPFCSAADRPEPFYSFGARWVVDGAQPTSAQAPATVTAVFSLLGLRYYGPGGQEYIWESIRQWRVFHPETTSDVRVLIFDELASNPDVQRNATRLGVKLELSSSLTAAPSKEQERFERLFYKQGYMHPGGNRETGHKDFNKLVTQRFYALMNLMVRDGLTDVVHLENDVMVYGDFRPVVRAFRTCGNALATLFPHNQGAIPGVLLVRDAEALVPLVAYINDLFACGPEFGRLVTDEKKGYANDMTYMMNLFELEGSRAIGDLPNKLNAPGENCLADELPGLLFDGAAFGQWYSFAVARAAAPPKEDIAPAAANSDTENRGGAITRGVRDNGMSGWVQESGRARQPLAAGRPPQNIVNAMAKHWLNPTPGALAHWALDDRGRRVPFYKDLHLYALHIHAKNLWWFRST